MLPPILEVYVLWHPMDTAGPHIARSLLEHFHGTAFSGLIGGAIEVYERSESRSGADDDPPPPIPALEAPPYELAVPAFTAVVVVAGSELANAVEGDGSWHEYVSNLAAARVEHPDRIGVFPLSVDSLALDKTRLAGLLGGLQQVAADEWGKPNFDNTLSRDVAQGIAQMVDSQHQRLTIFVSHTKRYDESGEAPIADLVKEIRDAIANTRLAEFFDAHDLEPGADWESALVAAATSSALLAVRTDLYSSRAWCQREVATAKLNGMPVVVIDGLDRGEDRGSFLMDHVPRVAGHRGTAKWKAAVWSALNHLVDECLKRALWNAQRDLAQSALTVDIDWWAPHAPEPTTFASWLDGLDREAKRDEPIIVLHPDPPLGDDEKAVLVQISRLAGLAGTVDFLTPRGLAIRGG